MWVCLNSGFLSIVQKRDDPETLLVRARARDHITNTFPHAEVFTDKKADYFYRAYIPRSVVALALDSEVHDINYDNFKNSVKDNLLHDTYLSIWHVIHRAYTTRFRP